MKSCGITLTNFADIDTLCITVDVHSTLDGSTEPIELDEPVSTDTEVLVVAETVGSTGLTLSKRRALAYIVVVASSAGTLTTVLNASSVAGTLLSTLWRAASR